jgi:hypothetical protein
VLAGAGATVVLASAATAGALAIGGGSAPQRAAPPAHRRAATAPSGPLAGATVHPAATSPPPAPAPVPAAPASPQVTAAPTDLPLPGCPPPPYTGPPPAPPWHPAHLVPDSQLPAAPGPPPGRNPTVAISGKGMWIWQLSSTDHGDVSAIVADATRAGLQQIWVRVGDSPDGFYGGAALTTLVPAAHRAGIKVIGWGFPYLFDPVADAGWTRSAIQWRSADGQGLDGWSADIETSSEGVALSPQRVAVYLGEVRSADPHTLLVATVFPPTDDRMTRYPFGTMAPYVDAYAPMLYWGCTQPVVDVQQAVTRLRPLGPEVHVIGQAYDMGPYGGRRGAPPATELDAFMLGARQAGAVGASFWSWQSIDSDEWSAVSGFRW